MNGITGQTWLEAALIAAILLGGAIAAIVTAIERRKRHERHNSHRRPRPRPSELIEEQWPSPAARALDDTGSMILGEEIGWRARGDRPPSFGLWQPRPLPEFPGEEPPAPELLDDLPDDPEWAARLREAVAADEAQERLAHTADLRAIAAEPDEAAGDWEPERCVACGVTVRDSWCPGCGEPICSPCEATGHDCEPVDVSAPVTAAIVEALDQLDEKQLAELLDGQAADVDDGELLDDFYGARGPGLDGPTVPPITADTIAYVEDLAVLTRYRIPAE